MISLSVIIPLAPAETTWQSFLGDLQTLPDGTEVLFVTSKQEDIPNDADGLLPGKRVRWLVSPLGRAEQMNTGASAATGAYLWFLHADSKFTSQTLPALMNWLQNHTQRLLYFDLAFMNDATPFMRLNAWGTQLRSRLLKTPYGDQGLCLKREVFENLGGYPEGLPHGEDHIFVWRARQRGIKIQPVGATLYTSARKYKRQGWWKTTLRHIYLGFKQAWPEWQKLRQIRREEKIKEKQRKREKA